MVIRIVTLSGLSLVLFTLQLIIARVGADIIDGIHDRAIEIAENEHLFPGLVEDSAERHIHPLRDLIATCQTSAAEKQMIRPVIPVSSHASSWQIFIPFARAQQKKQLRSTFPFQRGYRISQHVSTFNALKQPFFRKSKSIPNFHWHLYFIRAIKQRTAHA